MSNLILNADFFREKSGVTNEVIAISNSDMGDYQTPVNLTEVVVDIIKDSEINPTFIIEPTAGLGNFIFSSIKAFSNIQSIYGIEVQGKYQKEFIRRYNKFSEQYNLQNIQLQYFCQSIFNFNFKSILDEIKLTNKSTLIIGNPPWVTLSELSKEESANIPKKSNFRSLSGIDALMGKSNFDISEAITLKLVRDFQKTNTTIALLLKQSVIKNLVRDFSVFNLNCGNLRTYNFDSKKEFGISADAGLFIIDLNSSKNQTCDIYDIYNSKKKISTFGWVKSSKFVSNFDMYNANSVIDGDSEFEWRQGIKHDSSDVVILKRYGDSYINLRDQYVDIEDDRVYPFLKGSHLKDQIIGSSSLHILITQKKPNEVTLQSLSHLPKTLKYLLKSKHIFDQRKSSIYRNKDPYAIFAVGEYAFKPYKIAIPAFYKNPSFHLLLPKNGKALQVDDTSYYLSFDTLEDALNCYIILTSSEVLDFLKSISFASGKRPFTKEVLMRINLEAAANLIGSEKLNKSFEKCKIALGIPEIKFKINPERYKRITQDYLI